MIEFKKEMLDKKYMIEVRDVNQIENEDVQEKAKAVIKWCECASRVDVARNTCKVLSV